jgi:branched-chain amino acid transport system substrate-binding protein
MSAAKIVLLGPLVCYLGCSPKAPPEPILIGHLAPLSGPDQASGRHARQAIQLAVTKAKDDGLSVNGRALTILHADTRGDPEQAQAEAVRLLAVNRVMALITGPDAACSAEAVRAARPYHVPVVVPGVVYPSTDGSATMQLGADPVERGRALARYAARSLRAKKAVLLRGRGDPVAGAVLDGFTQVWSAEARRVEAIEYTDTAREAQVKRTVTFAPDVVLIGAASGDTLFFRAALKREDLGAPLLYGGADRGPGTFTGTLGPGSDVYLATVFSPDKLTSRGQEFARRYHEEFHEAPDLAAVEAYDAAWLLLTTINQAQSAIPDRVREELMGTESFESLTGTVTFKERLARRPLFIVRVSDAKDHVEETIAP